MRKTAERFLKYSSVGVGTFAFDLALLALFIDVLAINYLIATGLAFVIAISINYVISRRFVFKQTLRPVGSGYLIFISIAAVGLFFVTSGMFVFTQVFGWHYLIARIAIAGIVGMWNYLINLFANFKVAGLH